MKKFMYAYLFVPYRNIKNIEVPTKESCGLYYDIFTSDKPISKDEYCQIVTDRMPSHPIAKQLRIEEIRKSSGYDGILYRAFEECTLGDEREFGNVRTIKEIMTDWAEYYANYGITIDPSKFQVENMNIEEAKKIVQQEALKLKEHLKILHLIEEKSNRNPNETIMKHLVAKPFGNYKIKMYKEHHNIPHIHIDIGNNSHTASVKIEDQSILVGSIEKKYKPKVTNWVKSNKTELLLIWEALQNDKTIDLTTSCSRSSPYSAVR